MQECLKMLGVTWLPISSECFLTIAGRFGRCLVHKENEPFRSNWVYFYVFFPRAFERRVLYKNEVRHISYIFTSSHLTSAYLTSSYLTPALLTSSLCLSLSLCLSVSLSLFLSFSLSLYLSLSLSLHPLYLLFFSLLFFSPSPCLSYFSHIFSFLKRGLVPTSHNTQTFGTKWWSGVNCDYHVFANSCKNVIFLLSHNVSQKIRVERQKLAQHVCIKGFL